MLQSMIAAYHEYERDIDTICAAFSFGQSPYDNCPDCPLRNVCSATEFTFDCFGTSEEEQRQKTDLFEAMFAAAYIRLFGHHHLPENWQEILTERKEHPHD